MDLEALALINAVERRNGRFEVPVGSAVGNASCGDPREEVPTIFVNDGMILGHLENSRTISSPVRQFPIGVTIKTSWSQNNPWTPFLLMPAMFAD